MGLKDKLYDAFSKFHPTTAAAFTSIPPPFPPVVPYWVEASQNEAVSSSPRSPREAGNLGR